MKNKINNIISKLFICIIFLSLFSVASLAEPIRMATPNDLNIVAGSTGITSITITNDDSTSQSVTLTKTELNNGEDSIPASNIDFSEQIINLESGESKEIQIFVEVPYTTNPGEYLGQIKLLYSGTQEIIKDLYVEVLESTGNPDMSISGNEFTNVEYGDERSTTITLKNTGDIELTSISIVNDSIDEEYELSISKSIIESLSVNEEQEIELSIKVPEDAESETIGRIRVSSSQGLNKEFPIRIKLKSKLDIEKVDLEVEDEDIGEIEEDGDIEKEINPGDEIEFKVRISNNFPSGENMKIEDIELTVLIDEIDDGDEMEISMNDYTLRQDSYYDLEVNFKIPLWAAGQEYDVEINVIGEDEEGNEHEDSFNFVMPVTRNSHDVRIQEYDLDKKEISCEEEITVDYKVINVGDTDEDAAFRIINEELGIDYKKSFELSSDSDSTSVYQNSAVIQVPQDAEEKEYLVYLFAYFDEDKLDDGTTVKIIKSKCESNEETTDNTEETIEESETEEEIESIEETEETSDTPIPAIKDETEEESEDKEVVNRFSKNIDYTMVFLILLNIIVLGASAYLLSKYFNKK